MAEQLSGTTLTNLRCTSIAAPSQWEGDLEDARFVYIRYRHGRGAVRTGDSAQEAQQGTVVLVFDREQSLEGDDPLTAISHDDEQFHDSFLSTDDLLVRLSAAGMNVEKVRIVSASE
ncbi:hypothetical protein [Brevibacterium sp. SMBL_HHYL_HB1]|uniref:hypothetical protein n=1 Tax=Brevibacterium sp. SMBL_HHYL_HB1 TaxID=2777556 RepID=UPI001BAD4567|nr:hypothetical protein [Brevibacterium sp. SMBL_HHYL_HB1]QUL77860.1 hypothetical protein IG171_10095 [Brevibacterium sp. SMBL_HHYL_HB1]